MRGAFEGDRRGALLSEAGKVKRLVFFEGGDLVGARSSEPSERLGSILVETGRITKEQLAKAVTFIRSGQKLGQILVELDYLKGGEIEGFVRRQILDVACAMLTVKPTRLVFSERIEVDAITLSPVSIGDVFLEAVNRLEDIQGFRQRVLIADCVPEQTEGALGIASGMRLSEEQAVVLDLIDSRSSIQEIAKRSPIPVDETMRILIAFHESGAMSIRRNEKQAASKRPSPEPAPAVSVDPRQAELTELYNDVQCQNHWQVLGLERAASYQDVDRSYRKLLERLAPEAWAHNPDPEVQEKLSFVRARVKEAFLTLSSQTSAQVYEKLESHETQYHESKQKWEVVVSEPTQPADWKPAEDPGKRERLLNRAKHAYREKDFWRCIEMCRLVIELDDENDPEPYHLLGNALGKNPRWRRDAEKNLKMAQKLEPWQPRYLISLGKLYQKEGLLERAQRVYEEARTLDPDCSIPTIDPSEEPRAEQQRAG